jgi:hypothetical protein
LRQLKPHQSSNRDAIIASLGRHGAALDASDTGSGKSATFLAVCRALDARPAIVTRKTVIDGWVQECAAMDVNPLFITNYEAARSKGFEHGRVVVTGRSNKTKPDGTVVVEEKKNYEWLVSGRVLFCFDEVQNCRAQKTMNSKMLLAASSKFKTCMASATPFTTPGEAYAIGASLRLFTQNKFWNWQLRHGMRKNFHGHMEFCGGQNSAKAKAEALAHMEQIHRDIFPERGVRTRRSEIPGFPDEVTTVVGIDADDPGAVEQAYHELIAISRTEDYQRAIDGVAEDLHDLIEPLAITQSLRARQTAELQKCGAIVEMAIDARDKGESVAIFVNFDHTIEALAELLDTKCIIRGESKNENNYDRASAIREFQANRQPFILVNNQAGGAGVSLHDPITQKPRTSLISPPWSALVLHQVLGRTLRLAGGFSTRKLLFTKGTVEERVMNRVQTMTHCLEALTDGDLNPTI